VQTDQRGVAFSQADNAGVIMYRQTITVLVYQPGITVTKRHAVNSLTIIHQQNHGTAVVTYASFAEWLF
jgi:hypothetical protein